MPMAENLARAPDKISPPVPYVEECWVFKPLDTITNPLGLCCFYCTKPPYSNVTTGSKSAASTCRIKHLLEKAKDLGQPFTIVVFEGGNVTPLGLLQELHSQLTLSCIPIFTPDEAKLGQKTRKSCCPICTYIVKNDSTFLNHIVICHYWSSFSCGKCLKFIVSSGQQMKKHFLKCRSIKMRVSRQILRAASQQSHMVVVDPAASLSRTKRTRVTSAAKRRKMISCMDRSLSLVIKQLFRSRSWKVHVVANALLSPLQKAVITRVTRSPRSMAKSCTSPIRSCVRRHRSIRFQTQFVTVLTVLLFLLKYTVNRC